MPKQAMYSEERKKERKKSIQSKSFKIDKLIVRGFEKKEKQNQFTTLNEPLYVFFFFYLY